MREKTVWWDDYRGIRFEINRFQAFVHNDAKYSWTYYLHLCPQQFSEKHRDDFKTQIYYTAFGSKLEVYRDGALNNLEWHGGMTWSSNETKPNSPFEYYKFGCDFQHLWDDGYYYELNDVVKEAHRCIDSLFEIYGEIKPEAELWDEFSKRFPKESAGDERCFDINGKPMDMP